MINRIIGVASGKGGVGKSTVAVLLAEALAEEGMRVGILDADVTGPSIPRLLGVDTMRGESDGEHILPVTDERGIKVVSINLYLENESDPVVWRGPLLSRAIQQFWQDTAWGDLDYLIIDFPPGTADVQITAFNEIPVSGVVVVATPQDLVSMIVAKSVKMAAQMNAPVVGIVENMGTMICPECGKEFKLFDDGLASGAVRDLGLPLLARMSWRKEVAQAHSLDWKVLPEDLKAKARDIAREVALVPPKPATPRPAKCEGCGDAATCGCSGECESDSCGDAGNGAAGATAGGAAASGSGTGRED